MMMRDYEAGQTLTRRGLLRCGAAVGSLLVAGGQPGSVAARDDPAPPGVPSALEVAVGDIDATDGLVISRLIPERPVVTAGQIVIWRGRGPVPVAVILPSLGLRSPWLENGATWSTTFTQPGTMPVVTVGAVAISGEVRVLPGSGTLPTAQAIDDAPASGGEVRQRARLEADALILAAQSVGGRRDGLGRVRVLAGAGSGLVTVHQFFPLNPRVQVGDTVAFERLGGPTPHTVTFGAIPAGREPWRAPAMGGPKRFAGGTLHSGPPDTYVDGRAFAVTFVRAGVYPFRCALSSALGMEGVITVTDA